MLSYTYLLNVLCFHAHNCIYKVYIENFTIVNSLCVGVVIEVKYCHGKEEPVAAHVVCLSIYLIYIKLYNNFTRWHFSIAIDRDLSILYVKYNAYVKLLCQIHRELNVFIALFKCGNL